MTQNSAAFSYDDVIKLHQRWSTSGGKIDSKDEARVAYALTGQYEFADHAVRMFYADRNAFKAFRDVIGPFLQEMEASGFAPSDHHVMAALICSTKDSVKKFKRWFTDRIFGIPVDRVRFACRVMKRERSMDPLIGLMIDNLDAPGVQPSHLFMLDQYLCGFLPEERQEQRARVDARLDRFIADESSLDRREREVIERLERRRRLRSQKLDLSATAVVSILRKKPSIALCISGQMRGFQRAHEVMKPLFDEFNVDRFVHTWSDVGRGMLVPDRADRWFEGRVLNEFRALCLENKITGRSFLEAHPRFLDQGTKVTSEQLIEHYSAIDAVVEDDIDVPTNHHRMFYKIWSCHELMMSSGKEYDVVIRIRPDLTFDANPAQWGAILHRVQHEKLVFVETEFGINRKNGWVGDQFAIGSMEAMTRYASVYPLSTMVAAAELSSPIVHAHETLGYHMWSGGYTMPRAPIDNAKLVEISIINAVAFLEKMQGADSQDEAARRLIAAAQADVAQRGKK